MVQHTPALLAIAVQHNMSATYTAKQAHIHAGTYLETVAKLDRVEPQHPHVGAWGCKLLVKNRNIRVHVGLSSLQ